MAQEELELYKRLQPFFKERIGKYKIGDLLCIPLPIDPINPERGLWGMLNRQIAFYRDVGGQHTLITGYPLKSYRTNNPTEAILKALCAQENL